MLRHKQTISVRKLIAGHEVQIKTGQKAQLAESVGDKSTFVRVYPFNTASRRRSFTAIPIPIDYIVMLYPDIPVVQDSA